jgi:gas vesicle protein
MVQGSTAGSDTMGFFSGVLTGVAVSAAAAAWYMSRSGERFRDQYRLERRLGELGDQLEARTREIQGQVNTQIAEMRQKAEDVEASTNGHDLGTALDDASASAAEAAAEAAAAAETTVHRARKGTADAVDDATD